MRTGRFSNLIFKFIGVLIFFISPQVLAAFHEDLQTSIFQYASEQNPILNLSSKTTLQNENFVTRIISYVETGKRGTWSFDPDPLRYDFHYSENENNFLWLGREHPLNLTRSEAVQVTDAVGNVWAQNQMNALNPRVIGWFSTGIRQHLSPEVVVLAAYSPLFLPTFSPSLGFTETGELEPVRYARLPPESVNTGGTVLPIRYQLDLGQIRDLVLRSQYFGGITFNNDRFYLEASYFSAPRPNAVPLTGASLQINQDVVFAKVQIEPQFPREHWTSYRAQLVNMKFEPAVEYVQGLHDFNQRFLSLSGIFHTAPNMKANFGFLTSFRKNPEDPEFSDLLAFLFIPIRLTDRLTMNNLIRSTLLETRQSVYSMFELQYSLSKTIALLSSLRLLAGQNYSYFGDWRSEDSYTFGMRIIL